MTIHQSIVKRNGFSLIELMVVISVMAILLAIGVPSFIQLIKNNKIAATTNDIVGLLNYARAEAARRGTSVTVNTVNGSGTNEWGGGSSVVSGGKTLRELQATDPAITVDSLSGVTSIAFSATGITNLTATETLEVCDNRTGETGRKITILVSGIVDVQTFTCT